jgi:serine/threonine protein kinase
MRGKFSYMAPEQVGGLPFDRRIDVFSTGVMLHEMLTGRRLFFHPNVEDTIQAIETLEIAPPSHANRLVSAALDEVVMKALARDPAVRYASAAELGEALERVPAMHLSRREFVAILGRTAPIDSPATLVPLPVKPPALPNTIAVDRPFAPAPGEPSFGSRTTLRAMKAVKLPDEPALEPDDFTSGHEKFDFSEEPSPLPPVPAPSLPVPPGIPPLARRPPRRSPLMLLYLLASALLLL